MKTTFSSFYDLLIVYTDAPPMDDAGEPVGLHGRPDRGHAQQDGHQGPQAPRLP
jgi:hypothetical protein